MKPLPLGAALAAFLFAISSSLGGDLGPPARLRALRWELESPKPPSDIEVSRRMTEIARDFLRAGDEGQAIELLSGAIARDSANGTALATLTLVYARRGDLEFAEFYLDLARTSATVPSDPSIYEALGDAFEAQNRTDEAIGAWEEARRLGRDTATLRARIDKARHEWAFSHGQKYFSGEHFEIFFDPAISGEAAAIVEDSLERAATQESELFLASAPVGQIVILYEGRRYFRYQETPDWVGGYYDGKIRVPVETGHETSEAVFAILRHELAHAFLQKMSRGRAPAWLQEGLAQVIEGKATTDDEARRSLEAIPETSLDSLEEDFHQRSDPVRARDAYVVALSFARFLVARGGIGSAACVVSDLGSGFSSEESFRRSFFVSRSSLEAEWRRALRQNPRH